MFKALWSGICVFLHLITEGTEERMKAPVFVCGTVKEYETKNQHGHQSLQVVSSTVVRVIIYLRIRRKIMKVFVFVSVFDVSFFNPS